MKVRTDFVSNSSSCCYMLPLDKKHDPSKWHKNTLMPFRDNNKLQMSFDDFSHTGTWNTLEDNWAFLCCQLIYWTIPGITQGSNKSKKRLLRELYNHPDFIRVEKAVIEYLDKLGIECSGIELDEEEIKDYNNSEDGDYRILRPDCDIDHESIFDNLDDMIKKAKCASVAELIWGVKEIKVSWG